MKANVHPQYYDNAVVTCACGNTFTVGSTKQSIRVEICSKCHPFFTGQQKFVDTLGRVEKFQAKQKMAAEKVYVKKKKEEVKEQPQYKSLKDMLMGEMTKS